MLGIPFFSGIQGIRTLELLGHFNYAGRFTSHICETPLGKQSMAGQDQGRTHRLTLAARRIPHERSRELRFEPLEARALMAADTVLEWNDILLDAVRVDRTAPPIASRAMAIVHAAIYDAVNSIARTGEAYLIEHLAHPRASLPAAAAAAAHATLAALFPAQVSTFDAALATTLAAIPNGPLEDAGVAVGQFVASQMLAARSNDGTTDVISYTPGVEPGEWQPTPPAFAASLLPQWPDLDPFCMTEGAQFLTDGPPELTSAEYTAAFNQVKEIGASNSAVRTADQTAIALFWANGAGTATPPGHWNEIAQSVSDARGLSLVQNARLFALLNLAQADAAICSWDAKYEFDFWRPVTGIRAADSDGNPDTAADSNWAPLIATPPFPSYTSGHATFSGAAAAVLDGFFGRDRIGFTVESEDAAVSARSFRSFSQAAKESALSRLYGGIHWSFDNDDGLAAGTELGQFVFSTFLQPIAAKPVAELVDGVLIVIGGDGSDRLKVDQRGSQLVVSLQGKRLGAFVSDDVDSIVIDARGGNDHVSLAHRISIDAEIYGGSGRDLLMGARGNDRLFGEAGNDLLMGFAGDDHLDGGAGADRMLGGLDRDTLVTDRTGEVIGRDRFDIIRNLRRRR